VTPPSSLVRTAKTASALACCGLSLLLKFHQMFALLYLRMFVRALRNRHPSVTVNNLEGVKRGAKIASYSDYQRHRRDAK
jgi:hypothetical protein